jgi:hypothetical protein
MCHNTKLIRNLIISLLSFLLIASCNKDCLEKSYELRINFANETGYTIDVSLFPKEEFLHGSVYYKPGSFGGGHSLKSFTLEYDSLHSWFDRNDLYYTHDTSSSPSELLSKVFDSIYIIVRDEYNTEIKLSHNYFINYNENPFINDTIWYYKKYQTSYPNNDCVNPVEIKDFTYFINQNMIENQNL